MLMFNFYHISLATLSITFYVVEWVCNLREIVVSWIATFVHESATSSVISFNFGKYVWICGNLIVTVRFRNDILFMHMWLYSCSTHSAIGVRFDGIGTYLDLMYFCSGLWKSSSQCVESKRIKSATVSFARVLKN